MIIPKFNNDKIYQQVFVHRSYINEAGKNLQSNERLEFLGDSILSFIVSTHSFEKYPHYNEGKLTSLRSVLTNTETLSEVAKELGLGEKLKLSRGEEIGGGRENRTILANTFEALVGGIFIDQGLDSAYKFAEKTLIRKTQSFVENQGLKDPKSGLQEILQEKYKTSPIYKTISEHGPDHSRNYIIGVYVGERLLAQGQGKSKQEAEKSAAREALKAVG